MIIKVKSSKYDNSQLKCTIILFETVAILNVQYNL